MLSFIQKRNTKATTNTHIYITVHVYTTTYDNITAYDTQRFTKTIRKTYSDQNTITIAKKQQPKHYNQNITTKHTEIIKQNITEIQQTKTKN